MLLKLLIYGLAMYFFYSKIVKPYLPKAENKETTKIKYDEPKHTQKQGQSEDYIDYEEVD